MRWFGKPKLEQEVSPMSPARLLAKSLTDAETRGEWQRTPKVTGLALSLIYKNAKRDLEITRWSAMSAYCSNSGIATPFTLNEAETQVVRDALRQVDERLSDEKQKSALARLIEDAPAKKGGRA
jgi:hypothetical protein